MDFLQAVVLFTAGLAISLGLIGLGLRWLQFPPPMWIPLTGWYYYDRDSKTDRAGRAMQRLGCFS